MRKNMKLIGTVSVLALSIILTSCGGKNTAPATKKDENILPLSCVVVLPAQTPYKSTRAQSAGGENLQAGVEFLDTSILQELKNSKVSRVIETSELRPMVSEISGGKLGTLKELGKKADCNGVLISTLSSFKERQGGELAVDSPASAAFEIQLMEADSGRTLCTATFSETQSSLLENIFTFSKAKSRGFKWITVRELASQGLKETLTQCPYLY